MMQCTRYFCNTCFKTFEQFYESGEFYLNRQCTARVPRQHPLRTGKCDNEDQTNHFVKGKEVCGGELKVD